MTGFFKKFFTLEDAKASFNLFCSVYGIGTLGMPGNYARAGPIWATVAIIFMASANVYGSVVVSKMMLAAPKHVRTYGDMAEWVVGKAGRYAIVISQCAVCTLLPTAFLVLGGILLDVLLPNCFSQTVWIIFMAIGILPTALTPTLKEGAGTALVGCLGTILADFIALGILMYYMTPIVNTPPHPEFDLKEVAQTFGNLAIAYGAGCFIPAIQRQHKEPTRMPRVVFITLTFTSLLFLFISVTGYIGVGCQIPGNLLFAIAGETLGFKASRPAIVLAYISMQIHITIAFSVILHPVMYIVERAIWGLHVVNQSDAESNFIESQTPNSINDTRGSIVSTADCHLDMEDEAIQSYADKGAWLKAVIARLGLITILVVVAILLRKNFLDLSDFAGAAAMSTSCIIFPISFYLKIFWKKIGTVEKIYAIVTVVLSIILGTFVTYRSAKNFFAPTESTINFPFCPIEYQMVPYNNQTYYKF